MRGTLTFKTSPPSSSRTTSSQEWHPWNQSRVRRCVCWRATRPAMGVIPSQDYSSRHTRLTRPQPGATGTPDAATSATQRSPWPSARTARASYTTATASTSPPPTTSGSTSCRAFHDAPAFGHPGRAKTLELLQRGHYWDTMRRDVDRFVRNCDTCRRSRTSRHAPFGLLRPLPVPQAPWQDISMDFVVGLPWSEGCDAIWVVVDRLTKQRHLVPCRSDVDANDLADLFLKWVFRLHGLPETITSDRGPQFASHFWGRLCSRLEIGRRMSTAFHPQTDGQTERFNAVMEQYLRSYVNYLQDDWSSWLPLAEFAANNHASDATGLSPFFALHGHHPRATTSLTPVTEPTPGDTDALASATALQEIHEHLRAEMNRAQSRPG
jgi:transposase InsO family protein